MMITLIMIIMIIVMMIKMMMIRLIMIMMIADRWPGFFCRHVKLCNIGCVQHRQVVIIIVITIPFIMI